MKKRDITLAAVVLALAGIVWAVLQFAPGQTGSMLRITVDGQVYGEYSLEENRTIGIGGTNTCVIANGIVSMTEADCTDLICVHTKSIDARGGTIVCMPNRVVLEIVDPRGDGDTPDAVAG